MTGRDRLERELEDLTDEELDELAEVVADAITLGSGFVARVDGKLQRQDPTHVVVLHG